VVVDGEGEVVWDADDHGADVRREDAKVAAG